MRRKAMLRVNNFFAHTLSESQESTRTKHQMPYFSLISLTCLALQLRTQLTQAYQHSTLPDQELAEYLLRFQKEIAQVLQATMDDDQSAQFFRYSSEAKASPAL